MPFFENVAAWDQSAHLLFVQLFSLRVRRGLREKKKAFKALSKCLNSRCDGRSKNKQIGNWNTCYVHWNWSWAVQHESRNWLHVWTMTSGHPRYDWAGPTTYVAWREQRRLVFLFSILSASRRQTGPNWPPSYIKANKITSCLIPLWSYVKNKAPGHACLPEISNTWEHLSPLLFSLQGCPEPNKPKFIDSWKGGGVMFVKLFSRSDKCNTISPVRAIHHCLRRQSRGKSAKRQTDMSDWAGVMGRREKTNWGN